MEPRIIHVVISRDNSDFIYVTTDYSKALKAQTDQIKVEELSGGRPSVYIKTTSLVHSNTIEFSKEIVNKLHEIINKHEEWLLDNQPIKNRNSEHLLLIHEILSVIQPGFKKIHIDTISEEQKQFVEDRFNDGKSFVQDEKGFHF